MQLSRQMQGRETPKAAGMTQGRLTGLQRTLTLSSATLRICRYPSEAFRRGPVHQERPKSPFS